MNERISELAKQAGFYANPDVEKFEKFAELLMRECGRYVAYKFDYDNSEITRELKNYFGVEE